MKKFNVGILGTGKIAGVMADTLCKMSDASLYAVASRTMKKAENFADRYTGCKAYGSYEELLQDENIDLVYISTPNSAHFENMMMCIENGKNILCEKPFTVNCAQTEKVFEAAREKGIFVSEAMWTRYMPLAKELKRVAREKLIGDIKLVSANMHFPMSGKERLWTPELAGGAMLDVGIYPLTMASIIFGINIVSVEASGSLTPNGLDEYAAAIVSYENGGVGVANWGMNSVSDCNALIYGSEGYLIVHGVNRIQKIECFGPGFVKQWEIESSKDEISGYEYEVSACREAIMKGDIQTEEMSWNISIQMMKLMDEIRKKIGVTYVFDEIMMTK